MNDFPAAHLSACRLGSSPVGTANGSSELCAGKWWSIPRPAPAFCLRSGVLLSEDSSARAAGRRCVPSSSPSMWRASCATVAIGLSAPQIFHGLLRSGDSGEPGDMARIESRPRRWYGRLRFLRRWLASGVTGWRGVTTGRHGCCSSIVVVTSRMGNWKSFVVWCGVCLGRGPAHMSTDALEKRNECRTTGYESCIASWDRCEK